MRQKVQCWITSTRNIQFLQRVRLKMVVSMLGLMAQV